MGANAKRKSEGAPPFVSACAMTPEEEGEEAHDDTVVTAYDLFVAESEALHSQVLIQQGDSLFTPPRKRQLQQHRTTLARGRNRGAEKLLPLPFAVV